MDTLKERIAFARGLASGLGLSPDTRDGKMFAEILNIFDMIEQTLTVEPLRPMHDDDLYEDIDEAELANDAPMRIESPKGFDPPDEIEDDDWVECECPNCHELISLNGTAVDLNAQQLCPHCGMRLMIEFLTDD